LRKHGKEALEFVTYVEHAPSEYLTAINPDSSYVVPLGSHRLVCLDSRHDIVASVGEMIKDYLGWEQHDFLGGSPDSYGFVDSQIDLIETVLHETSGRTIIACHAPPLNIRDRQEKHTPPHKMREVEHMTLSKKDDLVAFLYSLGAVINMSQLSIGSCSGRVVGHFSVEHEDGLRTGVRIKILGGVYKQENQRYGPGDIIDIYSGIDGMVWVGQYVTFKPHYETGLPGWMKFEPESALSENFSLLPTRYFKSAKRDPWLGVGVSHYGFDRFARAIMGNTIAGKKVDLVLSGHTHQSIEYRMSVEDGIFRYYHDYYFDGTLHGLTAQDYWGSAAIPKTQEPLKGTRDANDWWNRHRPLLAQTLSLGTNPKHYPYSKNSLVPEAGGLLLHFRKDVIVGIERVGLSDMTSRLKKRLPQPARLRHWILA
jgi:hypothetical protein